MSSLLKVPVYLYGYASHLDHRRSVPQIRSGEYEGLRDKIAAPEWKPDFGPATFVPSFGASIVGARKFLIAYNVNLISTKEVAHRIALNIRENGRGDNEPGSLKAVQAVGWWLKESNLAQVSINILDFDVTGIHAVFEEVKREAEKLKVAVTGSQIVGLVPLKSMLAAADFYTKKENLFILEEDQKILLVVQRLGLSSLGYFDPKERIIEYKMAKDLGAEDLQQCLVNLRVTDFCKEVADRTTTPGGGSVAGLVASLGSGLASMTAKLSHGKRAFEANEEMMRRLIPIFHHASVDLVQLVDEDTNAYKDYVAAFKLPKGTPEETAVRDASIDAGIKNAAMVPFNLAKRVNDLFAPCIELSQIINVSSASDLEVGVNCMKLAVLSAYYNVRTNLHECQDESFNRDIRSQMQEFLETSQKATSQVIEILEKRCSEARSQRAAPEKRSE